MEGMVVGDEFLEGGEKIKLVLSDVCLLELVENEADEGECLGFVADEHMVVDLDDPQ
jgi:hypothetical protein